MQRNVPKNTLKFSNGLNNELTKLWRQILKVYFILDSESNAVKIGKANNIHVRLSDLQTGNPNTLRLMADLRGESVDYLAGAISENAERIFGKF